MSNLENKYIEEDVPDNDFLYRRASFKIFNQKTGKFTASAFKLKTFELKGKSKKGFSANWSNYSTPEKTSIDPIHNKKYCVGEFKAIIPRKVDLDVNHTPRNYNQSHCTISKEKLLEDIDIYKAEAFIAENCIPIYFPNETIKD
ncbi:hypothetical protein KJ830_05715 [bacterium]|nr:hypothetical protein [bacterium]MBU4510527.1 hypothetical protein [bacterium]